MAGISPRGVLVLVVVMTTASAAEAFGGRGGLRPTYVATDAPIPMAFYYVPMPAPTACVPYPHVAPVPIMPNAAPLANPRPAPASTQAEPPLGTKRAPTVSEARSLGGVYQAQAADVGPGRCKVGFWNITGQDITVTIDGQPQPLPKDRAVTLELERTFVWQVAGRNPQTERVSAEQRVFEVIIRP